jgi:hypothetical protein
MTQVSHSHQDHSCKYLIPMDLMCATCFGCGKGIINVVVRVHLANLHKTSTNDFTCEMVTPSTFLALLCALGSFACAMDSLLSQYKFIGLDRLGTTPNLETKFLIQTTSFAASEAAMYSASVVEFATVFRLELF